MTGPIITAYRAGAIVCILLSSIVVTSCSRHDLGTTMPTAVNGIMDCSRWDFEQDGPVKLNGEWEFYWNRQLVSEDFRQKDMPRKSAIIQVPSCWNDLDIQGEKLGRNGFATYRLRIKLKDSAAHRAVAIKTISSSYAVFVNGVKVASGGTAGISPATTMPGYAMQIAAFNTPGDEVELIVHVSNFVHARAGLWDVITLGDEESLRGGKLSSLLVDFFLVGSILIMGLYHIGFFILRKKFRPPLYFGIICIIMSIRIITSGETSIGILYPAVPYGLVLRLEYLSFYLSVAFAFILVYSLFRKDLPKKIVYVIMGICFCFAGVVLFTPLYLFTRTLPYFQLFTIACMPLFLWIIILAVARRREGAMILLIGFIITLMAMLNDILYSKFILMIHNNLSPFGLFLLLCSQALLLSKRFSSAFATIEDMSVQLKDYSLNLEKKVEDRTANLKQANEELEQTRSALWGEMQIAKKIQTVLLPARPRIAGHEIAAYMRSADEVGGDYYDVINIDERDWIIIGDVSGHGVSAGLVMMMVQSSIRTALYEDPCQLPSNLLSQVNKTIKHNISTMGEFKFMTITAFSFLNDGVITYSGRHLYFMVYRADTHEVELIEPIGIILGKALPLREDLNGTLRLERGDTLLLFTDGITEACSTDEEMEGGEREMFGEKRLSEILRQNATRALVEIIEAILAALEDYVCNDDVTMMIIRKDEENPGEVIPSGSLSR